MPDYFFDTSVLVAYFKEEEPRTVEIVEAALNGGLQAAISVITIAEICAASDMNDSTLRAKRLAILNLLNVVTVDLAIAERGGELRRQHNLALPDALIAACAEQAGGQFFAKDPHFKRLLEASVLSGKCTNNTLSFDIFSTAHILAIEGLRHAPISSGRGDSLIGTGQMKVLTVSDEVVEALHSPALARYAQGVEAILACGDLPVNYLEYLVSMLNVPLFYVMGNHGGEGGEGDYPEGGENVDLRVVEYKGLLIAGLEGAQRYNNKPRFQYTENEMRARIAALTPALMLNKARYGRYLDVLITHAPPYHIHDSDDYAHRGFKSFVWFIEHYQPRYLIHGHVHVYDKRAETITVCGATTIVNTCGYKILDIPIIKPVTRK